MEFVNLMSNLSLNDTAEATEVTEQSETIFRPISGKVLNEDTEIIIGEYTNRVFCIITQYDKIGGSIYSVVKAEQNATTEPVYIIKNMMGSDDILHQVAARYIAERLNFTKPLIIFLCLKSYELPMLKGICELIASSE